MSQPSWEEVAGLFAFDGSLLELHVAGTDLSDWQRLLDFLRAGDERIEFTVDGEVASLPIDVREAFDRARSYVVLLRLDPAGLALACHFFYPAEIEFDLDPRDIDGDDRWSCLAEFMRAIAGVTRKPVALTPEGLPQGTLIRFDPMREAFEVGGEIGELRT